MLRAPVAASAVVLLLAALTPARPSGQITLSERANEARVPAAALQMAVQGDRALSELYEPAGFTSLWVEDDGSPSDAARDALRLLGASDTDGLAPDDYQVASLHALFRAIAERSSAPDAVVTLELTLSRSVLAYLSDLRDGRVGPRDAGFVEFESPLSRGAIPPLLRHAIAGRQVIALAAAMRPRDPQYEALRYALAQYRALARLEPFAPSPPLVRSMHPGDTWGGVVALGERLVQLGDLDARALPLGDRYEAPLIDAVKRFQRRHALDPDGVIGTRTMAALMVPLSWRVRQLELAMERLRWLPRRGDQRLVLVNIPMFTLSAWDTVPPSGAPAFASRVIVGRARETETPIVQATLTEIQFRPYWNIPRSIVRKEILPAVAREPGYLERERMELVAGERDDSPVVVTTPENLARLAAGTLRLRQAPGPDNALGLIKFSFPNEHDVYMHATPAPSLFARARRDFSHGCIRVENPIGLAEWVLSGQTGWDRSRIDAAMSGTASSRLAIERRVRVVLFYLTAVMSFDSGELIFADDIYGLDDRLESERQRRRAGASPTTHASRIDVHEVGRGIEPDAAAPRGKRRAPQFRQWDVRQPNVDRLPLHVQTPGRDTFGVLPQHGVRLRRPIARNHLKGPGGFRLVAQVIEQVEQAGIDVVNIAGAEVTQEVVDVREGVRQIGPAAEVLDSQMLARVCVAETQGAGASVREHVRVGRVERRTGQG